MSTHKGSCLCQAVQYEITVPEGGQNTYTLCHCKDCQKYTGTTFASSFILPATHLKITKGAEGAEIKVYATTNTTSGNALMRYFCGTCGSALYNKTAANDQIVVVTSGTLDDPIDAAMQPAREIFCIDRRAWLKPLDGLAQHPKRLERLQ